MVNRDAYLGATRAIISTTSTGVGPVISCPPLSNVTAEVTLDGDGATGTGTFRVQGSLDGNHWNDIIPATTWTISGSSADDVLVGSTSPTNPIYYTNLRAEQTVAGSTHPVTIFVTGR